MKEETLPEVLGNLIRINNHGATFLGIDIEAVDVVEVQILVFQIKRP